MAYKTLKPLVEDSGESQKISHPAYGLIQVSRPQGGHKEMFGSDLRHNSTVSIRISAAVEDYHLGRSWYQEKGTYIEIDMTEAQWAKFVSSHGMSGTPVTVRRVRGLEEIPWIEGQNSKTEYSHKEFEMLVKQHMDYVGKTLDQVKDLVEKGKAGKKDLEELQNMLWHVAERFPNSAAFAVKSFKEETEQMVEGAKVEIEASLVNLVQNTGIEALGIKNWNQPQLENKDESL